MKKYKYCLVEISSKQYTYDINDNYKQFGTMFYIKRYLNEKQYLSFLKILVNNFYKENQWITQDNYYNQEIINFFNQYCKLETKKIRTYHNSSLLFIKYQDWNKYKILTTENIFNDYLIKVKNNKHINIIKNKKHNYHLKSHSIHSYGRKNKMGMSILKNQLKIKNDYLPLMKDYRILHQNRRHKNKLYDFSNYNLIHSRKSTGWKSKNKRHQWE